jgi:hypothetical protein
MVSTSQIKAGSTITLSVSAISAQSVKTYTEFSPYPGSGTPGSMAPADSFR